MHYHTGIKFYDTTIKKVIKLGLTTLIHVPFFKYPVPPEENPRGKYNSMYNIASDFFSYLFLKHPVLWLPSYTYSDSAFDNQLNKSMGFDKGGGGGGGGSVVFDPIIGMMDQFILVDYR
jgi:hypothetical protein